MKWECIDNKLIWYGETRLALNTSYLRAYLVQSFENAKCRSNIEGKYKNESMKKRINLCPKLVEIKLDFYGRKFMFIYCTQHMCHTILNIMTRLRWYQLKKIDVA